ncbi:MAG: TolC family protein [Pirellulales bacterium]
MSNRTTRWLIVVTSCITISLNGCALKCWNSYDCPDAPAYCEQQIADYADRGLKIQEPEPNSCEDGSEFSNIPISPDEFISGEDKYKDLSLEETVQLALNNSQVMRDLGGVLRGTGALVTVFDPAIAYTDGRFGEEAALSAFDASFGASAYFEQNDFAVNNSTVGTGGLYKQDFHNYEVSLTKQSATGGIFTLRNVTEYDNNNQTSTNLSPSFGHSWDTYVDAELRQPLLQGAGVLFNRIAGPDSEPGYINGVLIARTRTDISMADFEVAVRNLVSDAENAYWDLYFSYRDLDAKIEARDNALRVWQNVQAKEKVGIDPANKEGQAREQYYRFEAEVINSLHGRLVERTRTNNGSLGGTFNNAGGVRVSERRLRVILGLPINDHKLLRPSDEPTVASTKFDWNSIALEAIARRPEIRRQKWVVKQKELELLANKNFLKPSLDLVARYRARGFGNDLVDYDNSPNPNAWGSLASGDLQEYQMGIEFEMPLGFRRAHAAVRNSELQISRAKAILKEQENFIMYGLSNTYGDIDRAYKVMLAQFNRREAAYAQQRAVEVSLETGLVPLDLLLEAQRRVVDANVLFYQARVDYALAIKNVHFEKGSLLEYYNIRMAEGTWPQKAYNDALARDLNKRRAHDNYIINDAVISQPKQIDSTLDVPVSEVPQPAAAESVDFGPESLPNPLRESQKGSSVLPVSHTMVSPTANLPPAVQAPIIQGSELESGSKQFSFSETSKAEEAIWLH